MKRLLLISASLMLASGSFAQDANSDNSLYKFDNAKTAKEVNKLGAAPEFPFLRNMKTARQVYAAIKYMLATAIISLSACVVFYITNMQG